MTQASVTSAAIRQALPPSLLSRSASPRPRAGKPREGKKPAPRTLAAHPAPAWAGPISEAPRHGWEIMVSGELTDQAGDLHSRFLEVPRNSRCTIYFDSCGGSAYIGLAMATLIRLRGLQATAVVVGECSSAALMPFAACRQRFVTPHSTLLFHPVRWQSEEQVNLVEAREWARHFQIMDADQDQLLARLFGCELSLIQAWSIPGRFVSGPELVAAGLANQVDLFSGDVWSQITRATPTM